MATEIGSGSRFQPGYWESCKESLNKIKDPAAKFKAFDELTDRLLTTVSFEFLKVCLKILRSKSKLRNLPSR